MKTREQRTDSALLSAKQLQRTQPGVPEAPGFFRSAKGDIMRELTIIMRGLAWIIIAMLVVPPGIPAQDYGQPEQTEQTYRFSEGELAQMLAPIALYPDSLIAQILMASTYPLEVVEAERWLSQNKTLQGDQLDDALREKPWDPSIKSLCHFPDVLFALSDKLDQTRKLGDAFLSQQDDVMNTIQILRRKAEEQGNLKTTSEQQVIVEKEIIRIEPADPYVVYVPAYDPYYVYGTWGYPSYPPWYWYSLPGAVISSAFIAFGTPFFVAFDLFLWPWFDWHGHHVYSNYYYSDRHHHHDRYSGGRHWDHDPYHRKGVAYRDRTTSRRFDSAVSPVPRTGTNRGGSTGRQPAVSPAPRAGSTTRGYPDRSIQRQDLDSRRNAVAPRSRVEVQMRRTAPQRDNTFRGIGNGSFERKASERGSISRQSESVRQNMGTVRQSGGAARQSGGSRVGGGGSRGGGRGPGR